MERGVCVWCVRVGRKEEVIEKRESVVVIVATTHVARKLSSVVWKYILVGGRFSINFVCTVE